MKEYIRNYMTRSIDCKKSLLDNIEDDIIRATDIITKSFVEGNKLLICGNGGSAADSQHMAAEFTGRFCLERKGLPAIALTTDSSFMTAWSNDYNFGSGFKRLTESLGRYGDVLFAISTSGNSKNCLEALKTAKEMNLKTISLLGKDGGKMKGLADVDLLVTCDSTSIIQESHIMIIHMICKIVEERIFNRNEKSSDE